MAEEQQYVSRLTEALEELKKPFSGSNVRWRVGGKSRNDEWLNLFAYLEARDIMERLDSVCKKFCLTWSSDDEYVFDDRGMIVKCTVLLEDQLAGLKVARSDASRITPVVVPDGLKDSEEKTRNAANVNYSRNLENAVKGQVTDAFKRACVKMGIGRYLYMLDQTWVENQGKDKYGQDKFTPPRLPPWALPDEERGSAPDQPSGQQNSGSAGEGQRSGTSDKKMATQKQTDFLKDLAGQMKKYNEEASAHLGERAVAKDLTMAGAQTLISKALEDLKDYRAKAKSAGKETDGQDHGAPPGYEHGDPPHDGPEPPPPDDDDFPF